MCSFEDSFSNEMKISRAFPQLFHTQNRTLHMAQGDVISGPDRHTLVIAPVPIPNRVLFIDDSPNP